MSTQFPSNSPQQLVGVAIKTADYTIQLSDNAWLLIMNSASAHTFKMPATVPTRNGWLVYVQNIGAGTATLDGNGNNIDGSASTISLPTNTGLLVASNGTSYNTERGLASSAPPSGAAGGDLSGTYPNPTVAQVNGGAVPASALIVGTNSSKQIVDNTATVEADVQNHSWTYAADTGAANAYAIAPSPAVTSYVTGARFQFTAVHASTGASTLAVSSLAAKAIQKNGVALVANDIKANMVIDVIYDGTQFQMINPAGITEYTSNKDAASGYAGLDVNTMLKVAEQQETLDARTTTSESVTSTSRGKVVTFSNSAATAATIAQAGTASLIAGWWADLVNLNTGTVTLTPTTSTINGNATLILQKGEGGRLVSDGTNYIWIAGQPTTDTPNDADVLTYVLADKRWESKSISTLGGANASQLRGKNISSATPTDQQVLKWSATDNQYDLVLCDGLLHGDPIWDVDPVVVKLYDEFFGGTTATAGAFGNLGWAQTGSTNQTPIYWEGAPPHVGIMVMPPPGSTAQQTSGIMKQAPNQYRGGMPLLDYPGWKMSWVWRWGYIQGDLGTGLSSAAISSSTKFANYIGMSGTGLFGAAVSRPFQFIGLRFDTDAGAQQTNASGTYTTPGLQISDTTMKLECIVNPDNGGNQDRNNAQGIVVLQKANASSTSVAAGGTLTASFNTAIGQSNMIVVLVAVGGVTAPTVADTPGTSFSQNASQNDAGNAFSVYIFSGTTSTTPVTSSTDTITVTNHNAGAQSMAIFAYEIMSTQGGVLSFDASVGGNGTGTAASTAAIANAGQDELLFEITGVGTTTEAITNAAGSGWLLDTTAVNLTTGLFSAGASWRQTTLDTTPAGSSTLAASKPWALLVGSFKTTISSFFDTGVLPVAGQWYRLELKCVTAGQVQVTLFSNNSQIAQHTFTVPKYTIGTSVANSATVQASGTLAQFQPSFVPGGAGNFVGRCPFAAGSIITLAGLTGAGPSTLNGSHTVASGIFNGNITGVTFYTSAASFGSTNSKGTISGYAGYSPTAQMGNLAISTGFQTDFNLEIDMFKFVWDTSLASSPLTMNANYSRYVATPPDTGQ